MNSHSDYLAMANNSVNENNVNAKKARSTINQIKRLLKSLIKRSKKNSSYKEAVRLDDDSDQFDSEIDDNLANELLEARIFEEIDECEELAAVPVYDDEGRMDIVPVFRGQRYIPVHFAKTEAGTYFWTSMIGADCDISCHGDKNAITRYQLPELQVRSDRWAQA